MICIRFLIAVNPNGGGMGFFNTASQRFGIAGELLSFFARNKRWWMLPVIMIVLLTAVLVILAQSSALAPFIYTLF
jgi:hypothetical protein